MGAVVQKAGVAAGSASGFAAFAAVAKPVEGLWVQDQASFLLARAGSAELCPCWSPPALAEQIPVPE